MWKHNQGCQLSQGYYMEIRPSTLRISPAISLLQGTEVFLEYFHLY